MMSDDVTISKVLRFHVAALPGVGQMPAKGGDEQEDARVIFWLRRGLRRG